MEVSRPDSASIEQIVSCPANKSRNLLALFAAGRVTPPHVGPATTRRRASPAAKMTGHIYPFIHGRRTTDDSQKRRRFCDHSGQPLWHSRMNRLMPVQRRSCGENTRRDLEGVDLVVTGVPLDTATTNRPGARFGPRAIQCRFSQYCLDATVRHCGRSVRQTGGHRLRRLLLRLRTARRRFRTAIEEHAPPASSMPGSCASRRLAEIILSPGHY